MKKLDEISINAKRLYEDLRDLEESAKKENLKDIDFDYFRGLAKQNAFKDHILKDESEYIQKNYLYLMSSLLMFNNKEDIKNSQIIYINRLIEGFCNKNLDIENIYSHTMIMSGAQISDCIEIIKDYKDVFVVDSLICANIKGRSNDEILEYLSEIYSIMGIRFNKFTILMNLSNYILNKEPEKILKIEIENIRDFKHHINKMFKEKVFYDIHDISKKETGDIILFNYVLDMRFCKIKSKMNVKYGYYKDDNSFDITIDAGYGFEGNNIYELDLDEGYINLDKYNFNSIKFVNCKFNKITGINSTKKKVEFINCCIENIKNNYMYFAEGSYTSNYIISPININNGKFMECIIKDLKFDEGFLEIEPDNLIINCENCVFESVQIENCEMIEANYLINLNHSKIKDCIFLNNNNDDYIDNSLMKINDSEISNCKFKKCNQNSYSDYIILEKSKIVDSIFEDCEGRIGVSLESSTAKNNKFINCNFYKNIESE